MIDSWAELSRTRQDKQVLGIDGGSDEDFTISGVRSGFAVITAKTGIRFFRSRRNIDGEIVRLAPARPDRLRAAARGLTV